jgi:hypothetical protein
MNYSFNWSDAIVLGIALAALIIGISWIGVVWVVNRKSKNPKDTFEPHAGKTLGL